MQTAAAPAPAPDATRHEFERQGQVRYIVAWREHDCSTREIGHLRLPPKQIVQITDLLRRVMDYSHEAFTGQGENEGGLIPSIKTSLKIVDELLNQWGDQGLVQLDALTNLPMSVIVEFEKALLPNPQAKLVEIGAQLEAARYTGPYTEAFEKTRGQLQAGLAQALAWHSNVVERAREEYAGRMRGEVGIASYTPHQKRIAAEIGEELREGETVRLDAKEFQGGGNDALANAVLALAQQQQETNRLLLMMLGQGQQVSATARAIVEEQPIPPAFVINPDAEAPGVAPPDEVFVEEPSVPTVQPPKKRNR